MANQPLCQLSYSGKIDIPHYYLLREARLPERGVNVLAGQRHNSGIRYQ
jgi:hypothetical protein